MLLCIVDGLCAQDFPAQGLVISDSVRVRSGPSLASPIVGRVDQGTTVSVLGRSETSMALTKKGELNWWYRVDLKAVGTGWIYGAFVYLEAQGQKQKNLDFRLIVAGKDIQFYTKIYAWFPDTKNVQYEHRSVLCLVDETGKAFLVHLPQDLVGSVRSIPSEDQLYFMVSDENREQQLFGLSLLKNRSLVEFAVYENSPSMLYKIFFTCSYKTEKNCFYVEYGEWRP